MIVCLNCNWISRASIATHNLWWWEFWIPKMEIAHFSLSLTLVDESIKHRTWTCEKKKTHREGDSNFANKVGRSFGTEEWIMQKLCVIFARAGRTSHMRFFLSLWLIRFQSLGLFQRAIFIVAAASKEQNNRVICYMFFFARNIARKLGRDFLMESVKCIKHNTAAGYRADLSEILYRQLLARSVCFALQSFSVRRLR